MIKILLADDHQIFIDGVKIFLKKYDHLEIVGEAHNGNEVLDILENKEVDVVVSEINMPELDGIEMTSIIRKKYPKTKVLILSMFNKKEFVVKLMRYGASGYILKNKSKEELLSAINNVAAGRTHYGLEIMNQVISVSNIDEYGEVQLTERELEVLKKVAEGHSSKEAAKMLNISETTVNTHRRNIMAKLRLSSYSHIKQYAIEHNLISNSDDEVSAIFDHHTSTNIQAKVSIKDTATHTTTSVLLEINRNYETFTKKDEEQILKKIGVILNVKSPIKLIKKEKGSVLLTLELNYNEAINLIMAAEKGNLSDLGVNKVQLKSFLEVKESKFASKKPLSDFIIQLKDQFIKDFEGALNILKENIASTSSKFDELLILFKRFKDLKKDYANTLIDYEAFQLSQNKISTSFLELVNSIEQTDLK